MSTTQTELGKRIRDARLRAGMTQSQLARAANTSERNIVRWETDRNAPRMESVAAIAKATGRSLDDLLAAPATDDDEEEAEPVAFGVALQRMFDQSVDAAVERRLAALTSKEFA